MARSRASKRIVSPLFGLALLPLVASAPARAAEPATPVLPTGGVLTAGSAGISTSGTTLTVTQDSARAIIDWSGFSVGAGGTARFDNGSGATLNRVTGGSVSGIDGVLSASGSVYLINPNGVVIGKDGVIDVGGSFVAATLDVADASFMAGGDVALAGDSRAAVVHFGRIGALGGDVALIARQVENRGTITAATGTAALAAGREVLIRDAALDGGRFVVRVGGADTSVTNAGAIAAAAAELRANGGNVYALAGHSAGISATGVAARDGRIWLTAGDAGTLEVAGTLTAQGAGGGKGFIETSGGTVAIGGATIDAGAGGMWLLDPTDITIDQTAANTIAGTLNAGTSVTQETSAAGTGGSGDISVNPGTTIAWGTNAALTLSAYRNVTLGDNARIASTGGGAVTLYADNTGTGIGAVTFGQFGSEARVDTAGAVEIFYNPPAGVGAKYSRSYNYAATVGGGGTLTAYALVNSVSDLRAISQSLAGTYALGRDFDASGAGVIGLNSNGAYAGTAFTGIFDGRGHALTNFTGSASALFGMPYAGLFAAIASPAIVRNLNLVGGSVSATKVDNFLGGQPGAIGALAGVNDGGTIRNVSASVAVTGFGIEYVGGLVGVNYNGTIANSYASGLVSGFSKTAVINGPRPGQNSTRIIYVMNIGGLVGGNGGAIVDSYATGTVDGSGATNSGGLVGYNSGRISGAYASGAVTGRAGGSIGGFVAVNATNPGGPAATIDNGYWDQGSTGQLLGFATNSGTITRLVGIGGETGFSPYAQSTYTRFGFGPGGTWVMLDGQTRPMLQSEYSTRIATAHQLQLIATNLSASYTLANDIDLSATAGADVWSAAGFAPIGTAQAPFTGTLAGKGRDIAFLSIARPSAAAVGLFGHTRGATVSDLTLTSASVRGGANAGALAASSSMSAFINVAASGTVSGGTAGGLIGTSAGDTITAAFSSASVSGGVNVGGLIGAATSTISRSNATGTVYAGGGEAGGLVGYNGGSIADAYSIASVANDPYAGATISIATLGGLVGRNAGTIATSYATGSVTGVSEYAAGFAGRNDGTIRDSYWDVDSTGRSAGIRGGGGSASNLVGIGALAGRSAYAAATYPALDLSASGAWVIFDGATRPLLRAEYSTTIGNGHQLQLIAINPFVDYTLARDVDLSATANPSEIWNPATGFVPIGSSTTPFTGILDGGNHVIANLTIARPGSDDVGLFAGLGNTGTVRDLTLTGVSVRGATNVGGLAGFSTGTVGNVSVAGAVTAVNSAGGIVGYNLGALAGIRAAATVTATNFAGGIVGYNGGAIGAGGGATATGAVTATGSYAGGITGYNDARGTLAGAYRDGAAVAAGEYAGGIAGFNGGSMVSGSSASAVSATRGAGGVAGFNTGTITGFSVSAAVSAADLAGGFVGVNFGAIAGQAASNAVTGGTQLGGFAGANASGGTLTNVSASGPVSGAGTLGGLVGYNDGVIAGSRATGTVRGADGANASFVGGLVGYNARTISGSSAAGEVAGNAWTGGLVGYNDVRATIANSGATGRVGGVDYAGGLAGYNGGAIDSSNAGSDVTASGRGAGGLVGYNVGTVSRAYALGAAAAPTLAGGLVALNFGQVSLSFARGEVGGGDTAGGLVGYNAGTLAKVYATGAVRGTAAVGGLVGTNAATVTDAYATGATTGTDAATTGGLAGLNTAQGSIVRGYAAGAVSPGGGGIAGTNDGTLVTLFWDAGTTSAAQATAAGSAAGTTAVGGATGRSAYAQASYTGLNFLDVWTIQQGQSRPTLQENPQNPPSR